MKTFFPSIFTANELHTLATRSESIITSGLGTDPYITKVTTVFKVNVANLTMVIGRTTDSSIIVILQAKDDVRDARYLSLRDFIKSCTNDADQAIASAAKTLEDIFREIGWSLYLEGNTVESSLLKSLIEKLGKEPAKSAITAIGADAKLAALIAAHTDFETTFQGKVDSKAKEDYPKMRESKLAVAKYLGYLLSYIECLAEIDGGTYREAEAAIDEVITEVTAIARSRQTRNEKEDKKDGTV